jgi:hypothetical protein
MIAVLLLGSFSCGNRLIKISELAEVFLSLVYADGGAPHTPAFVPTHTSDTRRIVFLLLGVALVLGVTDNTKVGDPVILWVAVNVVDLILGPTTVV